MRRSQAPALRSKNIDSAGKDLIAELAEGNAAAMRILEDVYAIAEHEKADYVCSTTQNPSDLLAVLRREKLTGPRISDIYLHLCAGSAAHLTAALTVAAHPLHFAPKYHDSACYYLGLSHAGHTHPIPIKEFHAGVASQLKTITGQVMVH